MGLHQEIKLAREAWSEELRPLLDRVATGKRADRWVSGVIGAIEREDAVLFVARAARDASPEDSAGDASPALGLLVVAFQKWPRCTVHVLAMAAVPLSGFRWGPGFLPALAALARDAGAEAIEAEALDAANRRRLEWLGFAPRSALMSYAV